MASEDMPRLEYADALAGKAYKSDRSVRIRRHWQINSYELNTVLLAVDGRRLMVAAWGECRQRDLSSNTVAAAVSGAALGPVSGP